MNEARLDHQAIKIRDLISDYRSGKIVIPEFQRDYVWKRSKAPFLIDSLYKGFPVSSLLLWSSGEEARARRKDPRPSRAGSISWLIDGQQRLITLSRVMSGDENIDVVFHPETQEFRLANAATRNDSNWYRVAELWDDEQFRLIRRNLQGARAEQREARFERVRKILDYEIPAVLMLNHSFADAVAAFTRINTLGVKLKREDIESAQVAARHSGFIADQVAPFLDRIKKQGFSRITVMHLFRACAFIAHPDGRNRTPLHELDRKQVEAAWRQAEKATQDAIGIVRSQLGLVNMDILWSGALLVPLVALCASNSPRERDVRGIVAWLALAALRHRYSGASETALDQDLKACRSSDPIGALLTNLRQDGGVVTVNAEHFGGALVDRGGLLGVYVACHFRGLKDLFSGGNVILQSAVDRHHILPRGQFPESRQATADCVANIAFVSDSANRSVGLASPDVYLSKINREVLQSQCIPLNKKLWTVEKAAEFWAARKELLAEAFNDFLRASLPNRRING